MASKKLILGGAGAAALGVRVARSLLARWRQPPRREQLALEPGAPAAKEGAPVETGAASPELGAETSAAASPELGAETSPAPSPELSVEANPELSAADVAQLKDDLRRELERLADGDVKASRTRLSTPPRG